MDTLRSLLPLSRFSAGDDPGTPPPPPLPLPELLPATTSYIQRTLPYPHVLSSAAQNSEKAVKGRRLAQRLDESLTTHHASAAGLRESAYTLSTLRAGVVRAEEASQKVLGQLLDLERMVREAERRSREKEVKAIEREVEREDEEYERGEWERLKEVKEGYEEQLEGFKRERVVEGMHTVGRRKGEQTVALREVALEEAGGVGGRLEDFFGEAGSSGRNGLLEDGKDSVKSKEKDRKKAGSTARRKPPATRAHIIVDDEDIGDEMSFMDMYQR